MFRKATDSLQGWTPASEHPDGPEDLGADAERSRKQQGENAPAKGGLNHPGLRAKRTCISKRGDGPRMISDHESITCLAHSALSKR